MVERSVRDVTTGDAPKKTGSQQAEERAERMRRAVATKRAGSRCEPFGDGVLQEMERVVALGVVIDVEDEFAHVIRQAVLCESVLDAIERLPVRRSKEKPGLTAEAIAVLIKRHAGGKVKYAALVWRPYVRGSGWEYVTMARFITEHDDV